MGFILIFFIKLFYLLCAETFFIQSICHMIFLSQFAGSPEPEIKWYKGENKIKVSKSNAKLSVSYDSVSHTSTLEIKSASEDDVARYTVKAVNDLGAVKATVKVQVVDGLEQREEVEDFEVESKVIEVNKEHTKLDSEAAGDLEERSVRNVKEESEVELLADIVDQARAVSSTLDQNDSKKLAEAVATQPLSKKPREIAAVEVKEKEIVKKTDELDVESSSEEEESSEEGERSSEEDDESEGESTEIESADDEVELKKVQTVEKLVSATVDEKNKMYVKKTSELKTDKVEAVELLKPEPTKDVKELQLEVKSEKLPKVEPEDESETSETASSDEEMPSSPPAFVVKPKSTVAPIGETIRLECKVEG